MKTILIINDHTPQAAHAAEFALVLAQRMRANIILASSSDPRLDSENYEWAGSSHDETIAEPIHTPLMKKLLRRKKLHPGFSPLIQEVELDDDREGIFLLASRNDICMVVKGMDEFVPQALLNVKLAINTLPDKLQVPLLLVPSSWSENEFTRLVFRHNYFGVY
jgi:Universal stress protein family